MSGCLVVGHNYIQLLLLAIAMINGDSNDIDDISDNTSGNNNNND